MDYGLHTILRQISRVLVRIRFGLFGSILVLTVNSTKIISMAQENSILDTVGYTEMATIKIEGMWVNLNDNTYHVLGQDKENENVLYMYDYLSSNYGWTKEAVAGLCGNV